MTSPQDTSMIAEADNPILWEAKCKVCGATGENKFSWNGECLVCEDGDDERTFICQVTGTYCSGQFCDDYGCAKEAGFYDEV